jgi:hypothetical protein
LPLSRSGGPTVVNRILKNVRPISRSPADIVELVDLPEIIAGIVYWESIRDRAIGLSHRSLARMAADLAETYRAAGLRVASEGDCFCTVCEGNIGPDRN